MNLKRQIQYGKQARKSLLEGAKELAKAVTVTMGARGRNVIIPQQFSMPHITNDGVTIARDIQLKDDWKNQGAMIVKQAAITTNEQAGDGTTCATLLAYRITKAAMDAIEKGANPMELRKGMQQAAKEVCEKLKLASIKVDNEKVIKQVASISAQDKDLGELIGEMMHKVGKDGAVSIEDGFNDKVEYEIVDGIKMESGFRALKIMQTQQQREQMVKKGKLCVVLENCPLVICKNKIDNPQKQLDGLLGDLVQTKENKIAILADDYAPSIEPLLAQFSQQVNKEFVLLNPPLYGEKRTNFMKDLCAVLDTDMFDEDSAIYLSNARVANLPIVKKILAYKYETIFQVENQKNNNRYIDRITELKNEIENSNSAYDKEELKQRLANITSGIASIKVSAPTETDSQEVKYRVEDAVNAVKSAMEDGIVAGGGVAMRDIAKEINLTEETDHDKGYNIVIKACYSPEQTIVTNAGLDYEPKKMPPKKGYNVKTEDIVDMVEEGIIDPTKVLVSALTNAVSAAGILITTEAAMIEYKEETNAKEKNNPQT